MADINLTQAEADALNAMEKHRVNEDHGGFPVDGQLVVIPLYSPDRREQFLLDIGRGRIDLLKVKMHNRGRQVVVLVRLDLGGAPHRNPVTRRFRHCTSTFIGRATATSGRYLFPIPHPRPTPRHPAAQAHLR
jgi:hypothetical protein